VSSSIAKKAV
jgi:hypothetical protein